MIQGYNYRREGWRVYVINSQAVVKEFGVSVQALDKNVESFMNSLTEGQLKDMFKEKK